MKNIETKLISFREAMRILSCSRSKLYMLVNRGEIKTIKFDRHIRFDFVDIQNFIESKKTKNFDFGFNVSALGAQRYTK